MTYANQFKLELWFPSIYISLSVKRLYVYVCVCMCVLWVKKHTFFPVQKCLNTQLSESFCRTVSLSDEQDFKVTIPAKYEHTHIWKPATRTSWTCMGPLRSHSRILTWDMCVILTNAKVPTNLPWISLHDLCERLCPVWTWWMLHDVWLGGSANRVCVSVCVCVCVHSYLHGLIGRLLFI